jgi:TPR repeat protein
MALPAVVLTLWACRPAGAQEAEPAVSPVILDLAERAALGDRTALYNLGVEYYRGEEAPRNYAKSAAFWRRAAEQGNAAAMNNLGYLLYHGMGVAADPAEAVALWRRAISEGQVESHLHLGWAYEQGRGIGPDPVEAYALFLAVRRLAERSSDAADRSLLDEAREKLEKLEPGLSAAQVRDAEARADGYVRAASGR